MQKPLHLAVIIASTRQGRFAPVVARWFAQYLENRSGMTFDVIDLADAGLPATLLDSPPPAVTDVGRRLSAADAFVIITPEYNHSFPAPLKSAIDWYNAEWEKKPVGFVSYGGVSGGLRAVEQLRLVFAELEAVTVRTSVSFHRAQAAFTPDGHPLDNKGAERAAAAMLDQLTWWGTALASARENERNQLIAQIAVG